MEFASALKAAGTHHNRSALCAHLTNTLWTITVISALIRLSVFFVMISSVFVASARVTTLLILRLTLVYALLIISKIVISQDVQLIRSALITSTC